MIRSDKRLRICTTLLICNLVFIWGNSLLPGEVSGALSDWVKEIIAFLLSGDSVGSAGSGLLRKLAHFTEFASLGLLLGWLFGMLQKGKAYPFLCGAMAACIDETIQAFVPERGPGIKDVCIDTCGVLAGMMILYLGHTYFKTKNDPWRIINMKKLIAMILAMVMAISLFAGCAKGGEDNTEPSGEGTPVSALELMETVWAGYSDEQKFAVIGGSMAAPVDGAPGNYDLADENISFSLMIPAEQLGNVTEAASMIHMMNANTFTAAAFKLAEGVNADDFVAAMQNSIVNNQWICGFPEQLYIASVTRDYVVVAFGAMDLIEVFKTNLTTAYYTVTEKVNETLM